jgi:hypothetical protein
MGAGNGKPARQLEGYTRHQALDQCVAGPSSLLLVANKMHSVKTTTMTGTTKNGEVMCMVQAPEFRSTKVDYQRRAIR